MFDLRLMTRTLETYGFSDRWLTWLRMVFTLVIAGICMTQTDRSNIQTSLAASAKHQSIVSSAVTLSGFPNPDHQIKKHALETYGKLPLSFEANRGQAAEAVKFLSRGSGYAIFLGADEAVLKLRDTSLRLKLVDANTSARIEGEKELAGKSNYLFGNDASKWLTDVPTFASVSYNQIYPGVNLVYYGNQRQLEYDFVLAPGADASVIRLAIEGAQQMRLDEGGDLVMKVAGGELRQHKPIVYQRLNGERQIVAGRYVVESENRIGFELGDYDHSRELVIDPVLSYSTYLGGGGGDQGNGIALDKDGNVYVTGYTTALNDPNTTGNIAFPTAANSYQAVNNGLSDVFVSKLDTSKNGAASLVYSTFIGASDEDQAQAIKLDAAGNIYIAGQTTSTAFPITATNAYQKSFSSSALFKSSDAAATWAPSGNGLSANAVNALVVDGANLPNLYAGTANNGVYKSTDGGASWTPSNGSVDLNNPSKNKSIGSNDIRALAAASTASGGILYAATSNGVFWSTNGGQGWETPKPRFPVDANQRAVKSAAEDVRSLAVDVKSVTRTFYFGTSSGVFKSTDDGFTATPVNTGLPGFNPASGLSTSVIQALVVDSMTAGKIFAGTSEGVFRSDNSGGSWALKSPMVADKNILTMAVQPGTPAVPETPNTPAKPATPDTIFAATRSGVFKTTDGGETWTTFNTGLPQTDAQSGLTTLSIRALALDSGAMYAATADSVYKRNLASGGWILSNAEQTSTDIRSLAIGSGTNVFVGAKGETDAFLLKLAADGKSLLYSTFLGGGNSDRANGLALGIPGKEENTMNNDALAYVAGVTSSPNFPKSSASASFAGRDDVFVTKINTVATNAAASRFYSMLFGGSGNDGANGIAVDAAGAAYLTGGTNSSDFSRPSDVKSLETAYRNTGAFRSENGAGSWTRSGSGLIGDVADVIVIDRKTPATLYAVNSNGVFKSTDSGSNWVPKNNGLTGNGTSVRALVMDPTDSNKLYAGTAGGMFISTNGGDSWGAINSGLTGPGIKSLAIDPGSPSTLYASLGFGGLFKSINGGTNWAAINGPIDSTPFSKCPGCLPSTVASTGQSTANVQVISLIPATMIPATMANTAAQTIYAGLSGGVYKSTDAGMTWNQANGTIKPDSTDAAAKCVRCLPDTKIKTGESSSQVLALAIDPPSTLYASVGYSSVGEDGLVKSKEGLFKSTDGGANWDPLNLTAKVLALAIEPGKPMAEPPTPAMIYAATTSGVFKSTDNGASWTASNSGLTSLTIRSLAIDTSDQNKIIVYAGNGGGSGDAFVARLSADGAKLEYFSYLGGGDSDIGYGIAMGADNTAYVVGSTSSANFRTTSGAYKTVYSGGGDAFVARFDPAKTGGESLLYSTFLGGGQSQNNDSPNDSAQAIIVDTTGVVYVTGSTTSTNFPILNSINPTLNGSSDVFVAALDPAKSGNAALLYSTYLGGNSRDSGLAIALDAAGAVYVTGVTLSANFPISSGAFDADLGLGPKDTNCEIVCDPKDSNCVNPKPCHRDSDAFVAKISGMADAADLSLTKTAVGTGAFRVGENATYQLIVKNNSDSTAVTAPIRVVDPLPVELSFLSLDTTASGEGWTCSTAGQVVTCVNPNPLAAGASSTITLTVKVNAEPKPNPANPTATPKLVNKATVSSPISDPNPTNNTGESNGETVAPACFYTISSTGQQFSPSGGSGSVIVSAPSGCQWQASVSQRADFITLATISGAGTQTINFTVKAFTDQVQRTGELTIAGQKFAITQTGCSYSISLGEQSFDAASQNDNLVTVTAPGGCPWTATVGANSSFITITSGATGTGNGTVKFNVAKNTDTSPRTGTMTIAGKTFTVQQAGLVCTYTLSATEQSVQAAGSAASTVTVTAPSDCNWTAASNAAFITISTGQTGKGNGSVVFAVAENTAIEARVGTITIAGQTFTVSQAGVVCQYSLSVSTVTFGSDGMPINVPGTSVFNGVVVTTATNCEWQAVSNNRDFITITNPGTVRGKGSFTFKVEPNLTTNQRTGTIVVADKTLIVTQLGAGCSFGLSATEASFSAKGGDSFVFVTAGKDSCGWMVESNADFITILGDKDQSGSAYIHYQVLPNRSGKAREGTITIAGLPFRVRQPAGGSATGCEYSILAPPNSQSFAVAGGTGSVIVSAPEGCAWTAASNSPFVSITSGGGSGNGVVSFSVAANSGATARAGVLTVAGLTVVIRQAGAAGAPCSFVVEPSLFRIGSAGGDGAVFVNASLDTCEWTVGSNSVFITVTSPDSTQTGSAFISFTVLPNTSNTTRIGTITLAGQTFTVEQAGRPAQPKPLRSGDQVPKEQPAIITRPRTRAITNKRKR